MEQPIQSQRGRVKFSLEGYIYRFDKESKTQAGVKFWRGHEDGRCRARIHTLQEAVLKKINEHTHPPSAVTAEVEKAKTYARQRAENTYEAASTIINKSLENLSQAAVVQLPNRQAMRKAIRRKRNAVNHLPENPISIEDLELLYEYKMYKPTPETEENFCLVDQGISHERILIFGRDTWLEHLSTSTIWYVDGTFAIAPQLFYQVYIISVKKHGGVHPILYALLQNKQRATYMRMLEILKELVPNVQPSVINCDFEHAVLTAMKDCFPDVEIRGCLFHLSQNLLKQTKNMGHMVSYTDNADFALQVKTILSLSFVPVNDIDRHVDALASNLREELVSLLNWFEDNYIGRPGRRGIGRRAPLFPTDSWNMYQRTLQGQDRTNNHAEAANRRLHAELGMLHPTIWNFIDALKRVQKGRDEYFEKLAAGHSPQPKLLKYRKADERILKIVSDYGNRNEVEFLQAIAHNILH